MIHPFAGLRLFTVMKDLREDLSDVLKMVARETDSL